MSAAGQDIALGPARAAGAQLSGRMRALRKAARHSRRVRILRIALPGIALVLIAATVLSNVSLFGISSPLSIGRIVLQDGALKMENPRLSGYTHDNRAYELAAAAATQDISDPQTVHLDQVVARIAEPAGGFMSLEAKTGAFNTGDEILRLDGNIVVKSDEGYEMRLEQARVEMRQAAIISERPVEIDMLNGKLRASTMRIDEQGSRVLFGGGVSLLFRPSGSGGADEKR